MIAEKYILYQEKADGVCFDRAIFIILYFKKFEMLNFLPLYRLTITDLKHTKKKTSNKSYKNIDMVYYWIFIYFYRSTIIPKVLYLYYNAIVIDKY